MLRKVKENTVKFLAQHKWEFVRIGMLAAAVVLPDLLFGSESCFANAADSKMAVLTNPIKTAKDFVTGPLAGGVTIFGAVGTAANYMSNSQQSVSPKFMAVTGTGLVMTQAEEVLNVFGIDVTGCLFF